MATSSIVGGTELPEEVSGKNMRSLGPSDNTDSGSDAIGGYSDEVLDSDTDAHGTGERASVDPGSDHAAADIRPDHIERMPGTRTNPDEENAGDLDDLSEVDELADDGDLLVNTDDEDADEVRKI